MKEQKEIISAAHFSHQGVTKSIDLLKQFYYWPTLGQDMTSRIRNCVVCLRSERTFKSFEAPLKSNETLKDPWSILSMDIAGPIDDAEHPYILVIMDQMSRWPEVFRLRSISSKAVIRKLNKVFARIGIPKIILTDNGSQLKSMDMEKILKVNNIEHKLTPLYSPQSNGLVERFNRKLKYAIKEAWDCNIDTNSAIQNLLQTFRSSPHSFTGISPYELLYGRKMCTKVSSYFPTVLLTSVYDIEKAKVKKRK